MAYNGREFANEKYSDMCEKLNIEVLKTGADSPFQNGLCERNHAVVDGMLEKLLEDDPNLDHGISLASAVSVKKALAMNNGFSPIQLVTGKNPTVPSVLTALEARSVSKAFSERVTAALNARAAFLEVDALARVRHVLLQSEVFNPGDKVFSKRGNDNKWHGLGTVIGIDGKVIFVKHGRLYITCSPTRLIKANKVFQKEGGSIDQFGPVINGEEFESKSTEGATLNEKRDSSSDEEERVVARQNVAVEAPVENNDADRVGQIEIDERAVGGLERPRNVPATESRISRSWTKTLLTIQNL